VFPSQPAIGPQPKVSALRAKTDIAGHDGTVLAGAYRAARGADGKRPLPMNETQDPSRLATNRGTPGPMLVPDFPIRIARPTGESARRLRRGFRAAAVGLVLVGAGVAPAQDPAVEARVVELAVQWLSAPSPVLRAEAALVVGLAQRIEDTDALVARTKDADPTVRATALVALGFHGRFGNEAVLRHALADAPRDSVERTAAAFGLALLPAGQGATGLHELVSELRGSNWRRHREVVLAIATGIAQHERPVQQSLLRELLTEAAPRDGAIAGALLIALARIDGSLSEAEIRPWLSDADPVARSGALTAIERRRPLPFRDVVERMASRDPVPAVRARALRTLTAARAPAALELSVRAVQSDDAEEAAAGLHAILTLGGGRMREAVERRLLGVAPVHALTDRLAAFPKAVTTELRDQCLALARDDRNDRKLRLAAAGLALRSGAEAARKLIVELWAGIGDAPVDAASVRAAHAAGIDAEADLAAGSNERFVERAVPWLQAEGWSVAAHVADALAASRLDPKARAELLRAWRAVLLQPRRVRDLAALPESLRPILGG
jgi:hypothetical protein